MSCSLNSLKGLYRGLCRGLYRVPVIGLIQGDTRSLDIAPATFFKGTDSLNQVPGVLLNCAVWERTAGTRGLLQKPQ